MVRYSENLLDHKQYMLEKYDNLLLGYNSCQSQQNITNTYLSYLIAWTIATAGDAIAKSYKRSRHLPCYITNCASIGIKLYE